MPAPDSLLPALERYFGFTSFRPLQEEIMRDSLAGRDVFALLPTGGGKSLCFQLPALVRPGLTVVVSPLIALMKDQVDQLHAAGVPATFLNSSLDAAEARRRLRALHGGEFKLLYVAPERLMLDGMLEDLARWRVGAVAVDEAHCISEWGHDFRPEYRQLATVRERLPEASFVALTATATERVRADIIRHLRLRDPAVYVASFNRPNLQYRVVAKARPYTQVLEVVRARPQECGIVYCASRKTAESVAARLQADGVAAAPYHAGLEGAERSRHQEAFLRDEVRVICATIAFGMGINKPNVRFVLHHDLPKNIEGYYQETGRAGRDGLPGECLLLFSPGDVVKQQQFLLEKTDPREQRVAREQLQLMVHYAEHAGCRRAELLRYFGETFPDDNCGACDNCLSPRQTWDGTLAAQKLLSCVVRIRQHSGFDVGLNHVIAVLAGADTEKIRQWGHQQLSTYGIGRELERDAWGAVGRELIRLGLLRQNSERFGVLEVTPEGRAALKERRSIQLTRPLARPEPRAPRTGDIACDEALFERLRALRKRLADAQGVPPYIIFGDVTLRQMARAYPATPAELRRISGVGEKKLADFGAAFLAGIVAHLQGHPRQVLAEELTAAAPPPPRSRGELLSGTVLETLRRFQAGDAMEQIARERGLAASTVGSHLAAAVEAGEPVDHRRLFTPEEEREAGAALEAHPGPALTPVFEALGGRYDYGRLRVLRAALAARRR